MRGVKNIATKAPGYGPFANFASNPSQDKSLHFIEGVVPVLASFVSSEDGQPFDSAYVHWGEVGSNPFWMTGNSGANQDTGQWDATDKRAYRRLGNAGGQGALGAMLSSTNFNLWYPLGYCGEQTQFAPKNPNAQRVVFGSRLRFVDNVDYNGLGWGCGYLTIGSDYSGTSHSFNITRSGAGKWRMYSMDGSTRSSADSTVADDGNWHDFTVVWAEAALTLYVDNVAVITKTTNLPTRPIHPWVAGDNTHRLDIVDWRGAWEGD